MIPKRTVEALTLACAGDVTAKSMTNVKTGRVFGSAGIEAGGRIVLGTATTASVSVVDSNGVVLTSGTVTSNTTVAPVPRGVQGPLKVTVSASNGSLTVYWSVKK